MYNSKCGLVMPMNENDYYLSGSTRYVYDYSPHARHAEKEGYGRMQYGYYDNNDKYYNNLRWSGANKLTHGGTGYFSLSLWIKPLGYEFERIIDIGGSKLLIYRNNEYFYVQLYYRATWGQTSRTIVMKIDRNNWNHIVYTFSPTAARLYHNGVLTESASINSFSYVNSWDYYQLFANDYYAQYSLDAYTKDLFLYYDGLTHTEVQAIYNAGRSSVDEPLVDGYPSCSKFPNTLLKADLIVKRPRYLEAIQTLPTSLYRSTVVKISDIEFLFFGGHVNQEGTPTSGDIYVLDPVGSFSVFDNKPSTSRFGIGAAASSEIVYLYGGYEGVTYFNDLQMYNSLTKEISTIQTAPVSRAYPSAMGFLVIASCDMMSFLMVVGGDDGTGPTDSILVFQDAPVVHDFNSTSCLTKNSTGPVIELGACNVVDPVILQISADSLYSPVKVYIGDISMYPDSGNYVEIDTYTANLTNMVLTIPANYSYPTGINYIWIEICSEQFVTVGTISAINIVFTPGATILNSGSPQGYHDTVDTQADSVFEFPIDTGAPFVTKDDFRVLVGKESDLLFGVLDESSPSVKECVLNPASTAVYISCTLPPSIGDFFHFQVFVTVGSVEIPSSLTPDSFSYLPPEYIAGQTIEYFDFPTGQWKSSGSNTSLITKTSLSVLVTFNVLNLGVDPSLIHVTYGPPPEYNAFQCTLNPNFTNLITSPTSIYCDTQVGSGQNLSFTTTVGDHVAHQFGNVSLTHSLVQYSYPEAPEVFTVDGCAPSGSWDGTIDCPTEGGILINMTGKNFDIGNSYHVTIGDAGGVEEPRICENPVYTNATGVLSCTLPHGTGYNNTVSVTVASSFAGSINILAGAPAPLISYVSPVIDSIDGCVDDPSGDFPILCSRSGETITIRGNNFGAKNALVLVGGQLCTNLEHCNLPESPHKCVTCDIPMEMSGQVSIVLQQYFGGVSTENGVAFIRYAPCNMGEVEPDCALVPPGYYSEGVQPLACPSGKYQDQFGQSSCINCNSGEYSHPASESCLQCPGGTYASHPATPYCSVCPVGQFAVGLGNSGCLQCLPGTYQSDSGQIGCEQCPIGKFSKDSGAGDCSLCPKGKYQNTIGQTQCFEASIGYQIPGFGSSNQTICPAGRYSPISGSDTCFPCVLGKYQSELGSSSCLDCDPGSYQHLAGQLLCQSCEKGTYAEIAGSYSCQSCPEHTYQNETGATECHLCPPGTEAEDPESPECTPCPLGYSNDQYGSECVKCGSGEYTNSTGALQCDKCEPGKFSKGDGTCELCHPGTYSINYGVPSCTPCSRGKYQAEFGSTSCTPCPPLTYAPNSGSRTCAICEGGEYNMEEGRYSCSFCKSGTYAPQSNGKVVGPCLICPEGVDCETVPGSALAKEGWWIAIVPEEVAATSRYEVGEIIAYQCLPGRCYESTDCYGLGLYDDIIANNEAVATLPPVQTTSTGVVTTTIPTGSVFASTSIEQTGSVVASSTTSIVSDSNDNFYVGVIAACCERKKHRGSPEESNRLRYDVNPMCGSCEEGFYEWGNECLFCEKSVNVGFITVLFFLGWVAVLVFHRISQSTRAETKIFFYFVQMALLVFGTNTPWLSWLNFINFNSLQATSNVCLAKFDAADKLLLNIWMPFVGFLQLLITWLIHFCYWVITTGYFTESYNGVKMKKSPYIRTSFAMFLFFYNNITQAVFEFYKCIDTGNNQRVVENYPALSCDSARYKGLIPLITSFLVIVVIGQPIGLVGMLYFANQTNKLTHYKFLARYGILYETYRPDSFWWEMVPILRRTILIVTSTIFVIHKEQMVIISILNLLFLLHHISKKPFTKPVDNFTETLSLSVLLLCTVGLINVKLPLSANAAALFGILVFIPLGLFVMVYLGLKALMYLSPDDYEDFMNNTFMGAGSKGFQPHRVTNIDWVEIAQEGDYEDYWDEMEKDSEAVERFFQDVVKARYNAPVIRPSIASDLTSLGTASKPSDGGEIEAEVEFD